MKFTSYYCGETTEPKDNIVNIHKDPRTKYAVVDKIWVDNFVLFKKTNCNWYQLYGYRPMEENDIAPKLMGYIYKDRIKMSSISKG